MVKYESVQDLFHQMAQQFGANIAVDQIDKRITYSELESRSNNLANVLLASGASKGSIVALLAEDRIEVITAIIGILKAGCVFVPLDPAVPERRLETMVSEVSPEWFVIESQFFRSVGNIWGNKPVEAKVICLDGQEAPDDCSSNLVHIKDYAAYSNTEKPVVSLTPDDMCYVFFTSGSTGRPKGIAGRLKGIDHFIKWEIETFGINEKTRVSQLMPPTFDAILRDIFTPLCAGGTVCVPSREGSILKLIDWIDSKQINLIHCVPSLFRLVLSEDLDKELFSSLEYVLLSGETLRPSDVKRWTSIYGDRIQLVNLYGPSETTMTKLFYFVKPSDKDRQSIPIGKPMEGARALVVDAKDMPCPPGTVGEILIRTPFCTLGYYDRPELTEKGFIQNPFGDDPNDIVYRTGDLGRMLEDGNFEYLGRKDQQVKIRGVRVELGEIEDLLESHELVNDVVVVDREDASGNKYLCAYVVLAQQIKTSALGDFLSAYLPEYMIPSVFAPMDTLPRTISGKVNRRALPAPESLRSKQEAVLVLPRTPTEKALVEIWADVLPVKQLGVHDSFFSVGGHSLMVMQVLSRIQMNLGVDLQLQDFLESPTIEGLAEKVEEAILTKSDSVGELLDLLTEMEEEEAQRLLAIDGEI